MNIQEKAKALSEHLQRIAHDPVASKQMAQIVENALIEAHHSGWDAASKAATEAVEKALK